jgi:hypothetical protein
MQTKIEKREQEFKDKEQEFKDKEQELKERILSTQSKLDEIEK